MALRRNVLFSMDMKHPEKLSSPFTGNATSSNIISTHSPDPYILFIESLFLLRYLHSLAIDIIYLPSHLFRNFNSKDKVVAINIVESAL